MGTPWRSSSTAMSHKWCQEKTSSQQTYAAHPRASFGSRRLKLLPLGLHWYWPYLVTIPNSLIGWKWMKSFWKGSWEGCPWVWNTYIAHVGTGQMHSVSKRKRCAIAGNWRCFRITFGVTFLGIDLGAIWTDTWRMPEGKEVKIKAWSTALDRATNSDHWAPVANTKRNALLECDLFQRYPAIGTINRKGRSR